MIFLQEIKSRIELLSLKSKISYIIFFIGLLTYLVIESANRGDFLIFLCASKDLFAGENIYIKTYFDGYHYFYSVAFAIVLYPLTFISGHLATFLWLCFNALLVFRLFKLTYFFLPAGKLMPNQKKIFWIASAAFGFRLFYENFHVGQMTVFLLYLCLEGLYLVMTDKKVMGALCIAVGINIKLLPIVLIPYLFYRKEFKAAFLVIAFYAMLLYLPIVFIGAEQNNLLLATWAKLINPLNTVHVLDVGERSFHGLSTLLSTLFVENVPDQYALSIKRNIADVSLEQLTHILMAVRLSLILFTFYFLRTWPLKASPGKAYQFREICYILLLIPLIFPHQQHYSFLFILPAFMYCAFYFVEYYRNASLPRTVYLILSGIIFLTVNLKIILGEYNAFYEHFKILTYGALLLIIPLAVFNPKHIKY